MRWLISLLTFVTPKVALRACLSRVSIATHGRAWGLRVQCGNGGWFFRAGICSFRHVGFADGAAIVMSPRRIYLSSDIVPFSNGMAILGALGVVPGSELLFGVHC